LTGIFLWGSMNKRCIPVQIRLSIKSDHLVLGCLFRLTLLISETIARPNTRQKISDAI
jgi:hypothetical protein